jgi:hypothetical protein
MRIRRKGRHLWWLGPTALALALLPQPALAEGCLVAPAKLSDALMQGFKDNPKELLDRFPGGGPAMSGDVMRRAGSDVAVLPQIIQLARTGTTAHRVAIGIGLARAASAGAGDQARGCRGRTIGVVDGVRCRFKLARSDGGSPRQRRAVGTTRNRERATGLHRWQYAGEGSWCGRSAHQQPRLRVSYDADSGVDFLQQRTRHPRDVRQVAYFLGKKPLFDRWRFGEPDATLVRGAGGWFRGS